MIVTSSYPRRPLVDSDVLIAAWTERRVEPTREDCVAFLEGVENNDGVILIAAPMIAELLKGTPPLELPRRHSIVPVPFDAKAARVLGKSLPPHVLQVIRDEAGQPSGYHFKYDALIAACAKRFNADCIISLNVKHMAPLATHLGLQCRTPAAYRKARQEALPLTHGPRTG